MTEVYVVRAVASGDNVHRVIAVCERAHEARNEAAAWMLQRGGIDWEHEIAEEDVKEGWFLEGSGWVGFERWPVIPSGEH